MIYVLFNFVERPMQPKASIAGTIRSFISPHPHNIHAVIRVLFETQALT